MVLLNRCSACSRVLCWHMVCVDACSVPKTCSILSSIFDCFPPYCSLRASSSQRALWYAHLLHMWVCAIEGTIQRKNVASRMLHTSISWRNNLGVHLAITFDQLNHEQPSAGSRCVKLFSLTQSAEPLCCWKSEMFWSDIFALCDHSETDMLNEWFTQFLVFLCLHHNESCAVLRRSSLTGALPRILGLSCPKHTCTYPNPLITTQRIP